MFGHLKTCQKNVVDILSAFPQVVKASCGKHKRLSRLDQAYRRLFLIAKVEMGQWVEFKPRKVLFEQHICQKS